MRDMDWKILKVLHDYKNITKTATALYITQPTLTKRLQTMEQELNVQIVTRSKSGIAFTSAGEYLAECAERQVDFMEEVTRKLEHFRKDQKGVLNIGTSYSYSHYCLPQIILEYRRQYPNIDAELICMKSEKLAHMVEMDQIHFAFVRGCYTGEFESYEISAEVGYIISGQPIDDLKKLPTLNAITYATSDYSLTMIRQWWKENYAVPVQTGIVASFVDSAWNMAISGIGYTIAFISKQQAVDMQAKGAYLYPITDVKGVQLHRPTYFLYRRKEDDPAYVKAFVDQVLSMKVEH